MGRDPDRWSDLPEKLGALASVARGQGLDTLVLRDPANLTWLLGGRVNVPQTLDSACLDVVVDCTTPPRITVVTNAIESPRLRDTELAGLDATWDVVAWWDSRDPRLPRGRHVGSDRPLGDAVPVAGDLALLRRRLTGRQRRLFRAVCRDAASAATAAAAGLTPSTTEYQAAGLLARELLDRELDPIVLLVGGAARLDAHRHPLPTGDPLGARGMLVACARRHGLVASVTRIVSFDALGPGERDAYERLLHVEEAFLDASRGRSPTGRRRCRRHRRIPLAGLRPERVAPPPPGRLQRVPTARVPRLRGQRRRHHRRRRPGVEPERCRLEGRGLDPRRGHRSGDPGPRRRLADREGRWTDFGRTSSSLDLRTHLTTNTTRQGAPS